MKMDKGLLASMVDRIVRKARVKRAKDLYPGDSEVNGNLKISLSERILWVTDLTNAGKRGKLVPLVGIEFRHNEFALVSDLIDLLRKENTYAGAMATLKKFVASAGMTYEPYEETLKGIAVAPATMPKLIGDAPMYYVEATPVKYIVRDRTDPNGQTLYASSLTDAKLFYLWFSANKDLLSNKSFAEMAKLLRENGIKYESFFSD